MVGTARFIVSTIRDTMPTGAAGSLSDEETVNLTAYLLQKNKIPSGDTELSANRDDLLNIIITQGNQQQLHRAKGSN